jgi:hypothetical protein
MDGRLNKRLDKLLTIVIDEYALGPHAAPSDPSRARSDIAVCAVCATTRAGLCRTT